MLAARVAMPEVAGGGKSVIDRVSRVLRKFFLHVI